MKTSYESLVDGFSIGAASSFTDVARAESLSAPAVVCFYKAINDYIFFDTTQPEGQVIPMEALDFPTFGPFATYISTTDPDIVTGDKMWVEWIATDGSAFFQSLPMEVIKGEPLLVPVPVEEIVKFEAKHTLVTYFHLSAEGGKGPSPSTSVFVAPALGQKPTIQVEGVVDGVLDTVAHPDGIVITITSIENMRNFNGIEVLWKQLQDHWVDRQRVMTVDPGKSTVFVIQPAVYSKHVGQQVRVSYHIYLGAKLRPHFLWDVSAGILEFKLI